MGRWQQAGVNKGINSVNDQLRAPESQHSRPVTSKAAAELGPGVGDACEGGEDVEGPVHLEGWYSDIVVGEDAWYLDGL